MSNNIIAVVQDILRGAHGEFVVTRSKDVTGSITFSLSSDVWRDKARPEPGTEVMLWDVRKKRAGWRAFGARFTRPSDVRQAASEQSAK